MIVDDNPDSFQITVYEEDFDTPRWMSKGIMYQIFPDRFCQGNKENMKRGKAYHESMGRTVYLHDDWEEQPVFGPLPGKEFYDPCDYFGGDIEGIISKLDDLKRLGISCIYLNPIEKQDQTTAIIHQIIRKSIHSLEITKILSGYASLQKNAGFM